MIETYHEEKQDLVAPEMIAEMDQKYDLITQAMPDEFFCKTSDA